MLLTWCSAAANSLLRVCAGEDARFGLAHHLLDARHHALQLPAQPVQRGLPWDVGRPLDAVIDLLGEAPGLTHHPAGCLQ
jgi:hypothetical protein